jgi:hypothetical protein
MGSYIYMYRRERIYKEPLEKYNNRKANAYLINTRGLLRRKMELEYCSCELCIWKMEETRGHLFIIL